MPVIRDAQFPEQLDVVRAIFREYAACLEIDLSFQNFDAELQDLPGKYSAPKGRILLASANGKVLGCVAMRPLEGNACEMKRLYVRPEGRGLGLGKHLSESICKMAKTVGYQRVLLDTLPCMQAAQALYFSMGFRAIAAYVFNPVDGAKYLELDLTTWKPAR